MLLTEQEAKEKLCPLSGLANLITKELSDVAENYSCNASKCMMWRFIPIAEIPGEITVVDPHGYCGLAGRVQ